MLPSAGALLEKSDDFDSIRVCGPEYECSVTMGRRRWGEILGLEFGFSLDDNDIFIAGIDPTARQILERQDTIDDF